MDIDLQMNYWLAESTGLGETVTPLIDYMENLLVPRGQDTASLYYGARGWLTHPYSNIWAHTGPTAQDQTFYLPTVAAWLCQHAWDRYLYSQDYYFLRDHAYKLMKGAAQFWVDTLVRLEDPENGPLVVSPSFSPGHGGVTAGTAMDQQLVWQLLNNTLEAIAVVGERDRVFAQNLTSALEAVAPGFRIGSWGQLQEWYLDLDEPNERAPYLGYLWAVYPGNHLFFRNSSSSTGDGEGDDEGDDEGGKEPTREELLAAARTSLITRGLGDRPQGGDMGWAKSWRAAVWARLGDGRLAYRAVETFKQDHILEQLNLLDFNDGLSGLLGVGAAMVEMVIQSRAPGYVDILTVTDLPNQWLKRGGSVEGFRTREGHVVSSRWEVGGTVRQVEVFASLKTGSLRVKVGSLGGEERTPSEKVRVSLKDSTKVVGYSREGDVVVMAVAKGQTYVIDIDD
jgi:alpha-L-fucosidase 2